ncbi:succinate--coA ligase [ADP-forming] subunit beta [Physcia stellaris]|nr:succinate--coA ligase [ADP-forming] subunit beta [Physcia stellaris]
MALIFRRLKSTAASASTKLIAEELITRAQKAGPITQRQLIDANQLQRLSLTLDRPHLYKSQSTSREAPREGTPIPPGYHLAYFTPAALPDELGVDGTDRSYSPSKPYTRRMWAGGELSWDVENRLRVGEEVTETTRFLSADAKVTRTGEEMIVVGVEKTFENQDGIALVDKEIGYFAKELLEPNPVRCLDSRKTSTLPKPTGAEVFSATFFSRQSPCFVSQH